MCVLFLQSFVCQLRFVAACWIVSRYLVLLTGFKRFRIRFRLVSYLRRLKTVSISGADNNYTQKWQNLYILVVFVEKKLLFRHFQRKFSTGFLPARESLSTDAMLEHIKFDPNLIFNEEFLFGILKWIFAPKLPKINCVWKKKNQIIFSKIDKNKNIIVRWFAL